MNNPDRSLSPVACRSQAYLVDADGEFLTTEPLVEVHLVYRAQDPLAVELAIVSRPAGRRPRKCATI